MRIVTITGDQARHRWVIRQFSPVAAVVQYRKPVNDNSEVLKMRP